MIACSAFSGFPRGSAGEESHCPSPRNAGDLGSIPGLGRSPGDGKGDPLDLLQYCGLENSMDCVVHEVAKSRTQLSDFHFHITYSAPSGLGYSIWNLHGLMWDLSLWGMDSLIAARRLHCSGACGILVPQPGIEPTPAALQERASPAGPPGKSSPDILIKKLSHEIRKT